MFLRRFSPDPTKLPPSIYAALVDSLFSNPAPMLFGGLSSAIAAVLTAYKTGETMLWPVALVMALVSVVRALQMARYQRKPSPLQPLSAAMWETYYQIGALSYSGLMGIWCFITIYFTDDPVAHMLCTAVTIANAAAGAGRAY